MAHELEIDANGKASMFWVGETPWHGLGTQLEAPPTIEEALVAAGLDWDVELQPLYVSRSAGEGAPEVLEEAPGFATVRSTDGAVLGVVGERYRPLQNREAFAWFQPFLDAGEAVLETAGSLRGGRDVWVLARLNLDPIEVARGDRVLPYLLLGNNHTGVKSAFCGFNQVRVVCANTLAAAESIGSGKLLRVRHTESVVEALASVRDAMQMARQGFEATAEQMRFMTEVGVDESDVERLVRRVHELPDGKGARVVGAVLDLYRGGRGTSDTAPTVWRAYNAVTEHLTWKRGNSAGNRLFSNWFDGSLGRRAWDEALRLARQLFGKR